MTPHADPRSLQGRETKRTRSVLRSGLAGESWGVVLILNNTRVLLFIGNQKKNKNTPHFIPSCPSPSD